MTLTDQYAIKHYPTHNHPTEVHFQTNTQGKDMNPVIPLLLFYEDDFGIK